MRKYSNYKDKFWSWKLTIFYNYFSRLLITVSLQGDMNKKLLFGQVPKESFNVEE